MNYSTSSAWTRGDGNAMQPIAASPVIDPISPTLLERDLTPDRLARRWNGLDIYILKGLDVPHVLDEIGRIREIEFRREGGGTGRDKDVDTFDLGDVSYWQIVTWDPIEREIVSTYRYLIGSEALQQKGPEAFATYELFDFSDEFICRYLPYTIELGRSVVNRQAKKKRLGLWAAWLGLGVIITEYPEMDYFFGKVTIPPSYPEDARDLLCNFWECVLPGQSHLVRPRAVVKVAGKGSGTSDFETNRNFETHYENLQERLKTWGVTVPPLMNSYLGLTSNIETFGTVVNRHFGNAFETSILLPIRDIHPKRREQFIESYVTINPGLFQPSRMGPAS
jgi:hypothetical protein